MEPTVLRVLTLSAGGAPLSTGSSTFWRRATDDRGAVVHLFITNSHVVLSGDQFALLDPEHPGAGVRAKLLGLCPSADIAVLSAGPPADPALAATLADAVPLRTPPDGALGLEEATAVGFPLNLPEITRSSGDVGLQLFADTVVFQLSKSLNPGNSGGALVDAGGVWWGVPFVGIQNVSDIAFCVTYLEALAVAATIVRAYAGAPVRLGPLAITGTTPPPGATVGSRLEVVDGPGAPLARMRAPGGGLYPVAPLTFWMRLLEPGSYPVVAGGATVGVLTSAYPVARHTTPARSITFAGAHLVPLAPGHGVPSPRAAALVVAAALDPALRGALVHTVNGRRVHTVEDVRDALGDAPTVLGTTAGEYVF